MKYFLLSIGLLLSMNVNAHSLIKVYSVANPLKAGEVSQSEGVKRALIESSLQDLSAGFLDARNPEVIRQTIETDLDHKERVILIGAGEEGIDAIERLPSHPNLITCLTSHMLLSRYTNPLLLKKVDFIALPSHLSPQNKHIIGGKLIQTIGVAHNRDKASMEQTYKKWAQDLPSCSFTLSVILGGDAPTPPPTKGIKRFTKKDAIRLADYITSLPSEKKACVVVLNGPRTGKYDANGKEVLTVHRKGYSDPITEFFLQSLKEKGIHATVFDFQHKTSENEKWARPYSSFDLLVGALQTHEGLLLVPGESTSMISESIDTLPSGKVLVYKNGAMNDAHEAHVASELAVGRVSVLAQDNQVKAPSSSGQTLPPSASKVIAQILLNAAKNRWK